MLRWLVRTYLPAAVTNLMGIPNGLPCPTRTAAVLPSSEHDPRGRRRSGGHPNHRDITRRLSVSFQAYLDAIESKTGKTPRVLLHEAKQLGLTGPEVKAGGVIDWLARDYGLGRGHAMTLVHVIKNGPVAPTKHVNSGGTHSDPSSSSGWTGRPPGRRLG